MERTTNCEAAPALSGARILIVEDEFVIAADLKSALSEAGAEIVCVCRTVEDALALTDEEDLAAAVLDFRLGHETVAPVARQLAARGVPFVFYSGQVDTDQVRAEWPLSKIIPKPTRLRTIVDAIAALLKQRDVLLMDVSFLRH